MLTGNVAVVTGGAAGIGEAIARLFGRHGATVAVLDKDDAPARAVAGAIEAEIDGFVHAPHVGLEQLGAAVAGAVGEQENRLAAAGLRDRGRDLGRVRRSGGLPLGATDRALLR